MSMPVALRSAPSVSLGGLCAHGLTIGHGPRRLLRDVDLEIHRGTVVGLLGRNGSGKSTLLSCLAGQHPATSGHVSLLGRQLQRWDARGLARVRAYLPQRAPAAPGIEVHEWLTLGRWPYPSRGEALSDLHAVAAAAQACGVVPLLGRRCDTLSGGELQRVRIARALAQLDLQSHRGSYGAETAIPETPQASSNTTIGPERLASIDENGPQRDAEHGWLLLDEPTSALDLAHALAVGALWRQLAAHGLSVLVALHDLDLACRCCDRLIVLGDGQILADGRPAQTLSPELFDRAFGVRGRLHQLREHSSPLIVLEDPTAPLAHARFGSSEQRQG